MSSDDSSKAEEERIQRAMNRKPRSSVVVKSGNEPTTVERNPSTFGTSHSRQSMVTKAPSFDNKPKPTPVVEKPKPIVVRDTTTSTTSPITSPHSRSLEIENLQMKKRTILGTISTGKRDLEDVRNEIAKLKAKEAELVAVIEKREQAVQQITQEIEAAETKDRNEEQKRKEEEKQKKIKEEIDRRRKEEGEEERKKNEEEQEKKVLNPQPVYTPHSEEEIGDDGLNQEELRLMRAMSRPGKGSVATRVTAPQVTKPAAPKQISEEEKKRIAEENKKKEEEQRLAQERDLQQRIAHLQSAGGVSKTFVSPQVYDFDADVKFVADFTNWEEIPITTPMDNNFTYSVNWKVSPGWHFTFLKLMV